MMGVRLLFWMLVLALGVVGLTVTTGCKEDDQKALAKLDPPLARLLQDKASKDHQIQVFLQLRRPLDQDQRIALEEAGGVVQAEFGRYYTCQLVVRNLLRVAKLEFVDQIHPGTTLRIPE